MRAGFLGWTLAAALAAGCGGGSGSDTTVPANDVADTMTTDVPVDAATDPGMADGTDLLPSDPGPGADPGTGTDLGPGVDLVVADPGADLATDLPPPHDPGPSDTLPPPDLGPDAIPSDMGPMDTRPDASAFATCSGLMACITSCQTAECPQLCRDGASAPALADLQAYEECITGECPSCVPPEGAGCAACRATAQAGACSEQATTCGLPTTVGDQPCAAVLDCVKGCSDVPCGNACMAQAAPAAKPLFDAVGACVGPQCPDLAGPMWDACVAGASTGACKSQFDACAAQTSL